MVVRELHINRRVSRFKGVLAVWPQILQENHKKSADEKRYPKKQNKSEKCPDLVLLALLLLGLLDLFLKIKFIQELFVAVPDCHFRDTSDVRDLTLRAFLTMDECAHIESSSGDTRRTTTISRNANDRLLVSLVSAKPIHGHAESGPDQYDRHYAHDTGVRISVRLASKRERRFRRTDSPVLSCRLCGFHGR